MSYGKGGGNAGYNQPSVDAPTNGPGMPPPLANAGVNPTNINATQPGFEIADPFPHLPSFGGKSVPTPETQEPYTPGAYDPGPVRSQQDRFQGYNVPTPNYAQFNQQVAQPQPGPVQPGDEPSIGQPGMLPGGKSIQGPIDPGFGVPNFGKGRPGSGALVPGLPDGVEKGFGMPPPGIGQPIAEFYGGMGRPSAEFQPAGTASMTPQDYYTQYAKTIFDVDPTYESAVEGATDIYNQ